MEEYRSIYRAFQDYKQAVSGDPLHDSLLRSLWEDAQAEEHLTDECSTLVWDQEWIQAFEEALPYVEKAIDEQRRFIESYSEIRRVDQARKTGVDSIRHLAQHSNLISRVDGPDVIPDKILIVQREDNYAIYENRFLYTLVKQMQEFLQRRYAAALEANGLRQLRLRFDRNGQGGGMRFQSRLSFLLDRLPDRSASLREDGEDMTDMERVEALVRKTHLLSATPLMHMLRGCTQVTSPIVRTNVFKNNPNFKQALNLFEFLQRYQKPGYEIIRDESAAAAFPEALRGDLGELMLLQALFSRFQLEDGLEESLSEDRSLAREAQDLRARQQAAVRAQDARSQVAQARREETARRNQEIAARDAIIARQEAEIARQMGEISDLKISLDRAKAHVEDLTRQLAEQKESYEQQLAEQKESYERQLAEQKESYERQLAEQKDSCERQLAEQKESYEQQLAGQKTDYEARIQTLQNTLAETKADYEKQITDLNEKHKEQIDELKRGYEQQIADLKSGYEHQIADLKRGYEQQIADLNKEHERHIAELKSGYERQINDLNQEHERQLAETRAESRQRLEQTISEARQRLDSALAEERRQSGEARQAAETRRAQETAALQEKLDATRAEAERSQEKAAADAARMDQALQDARSEALQARSDLAAERKQRREDLEQAKAQVLAARKDADDAQAKLRSQEQSLLEAQRQLRDAREKSNSLQKQLIQARESARKARGENPARSLHQVARKIWNGGQKK